MPTNLLPVNGFYNIYDDHTNGWRWATRAEAQSAAKTADRRCIYRIRVTMKPRRYRQ